MSSSYVTTLTQTAAYPLAFRANTRPISAAGIWADRAGFGLLSLAVGDLLLRPADFWPALAGAPIHKLLLIACLGLSLPRVLGSLSIESLRPNAITVLVLLLVPAVMLSHLAHKDTFDARMGGMEMVKVCVFFLLMVTLIDSMRRLRTILLAVAAATTAMAALAVAQHHGLIHLAALAGVEQSVSGMDGPASLTRLCGVGVFHDPNDLSLLLVIAMIVCAYGLSERHAGVARWLLIAPIGLLGYALYLTHSRGGLLSGVAALAAFTAARLGWRNTLLLACPACIVLLAPLLGRLTEFNLTDPEDSFQARLRLWNDSLDAFFAAPVFGIGEGKLVDAIGQVAHNSYLQAFTEMGLVGGTVFAGAVCLIVRSLWRAAPVDGDLARARPYVLALTFGYAAGLLALTRCYTAPTLLVLALGTAYLVIASRSGGVVLPRLSWRCVRRITLVGLAFLAATCLFLQFILQQVES